MKDYFNFAYNPVYDFAVGRLNPYRKLQERCVSKLELKDDDRVLCVGLGTGNEVSRILKVNRNVSIVGVDYSHTALRKARRKALAWGKEIEVLPMDARHLEFTEGSFDRVLCIHVVDFMEDGRETISEMLRVLKTGGQFVVTFPSGKENTSFGIKLFKEHIRHHIRVGKSYLRTIGGLFIQMLLAMVYLPLLLRRGKRAYSLHELNMIIDASKIEAFSVEEDPIYHDFIAYGTK